MTALPPGGTTGLEAPASVPGSSAGPGGRTHLVGGSRLVTSPKPPQGLQQAGRGLWEAFVGAYDWEAHELPQLGLAAGQADLVAQLERLLVAQGLEVEGSRGQTRLNPAVAELGRQRLALSKLIDALPVPVDGAEDKVESPAQKRARKAVTARWDRVRERESRALSVADGAS